jgi:hypothetical protein
VKQYTGARKRPDPRTWSRTWIGAKNCDEGRIQTRSVKTKKKVIEPRTLRYKIMEQMNEFKKRA